MPYFRASSAAWPGVGEATATTSASSGMIWNDAAWMSASNWEPIIPTFTFPFGIEEVFSHSHSGLDQALRHFPLQRHYGFVIHWRDAATEPFNGREQRLSGGRGGFGRQAPRDGQ